MKILCVIYVMANMCALFSIVPSDQNVPVDIVLALDVVALVGLAIIGIIQMIDGDR